MKKIVLSLALVATMAFVSCKETAKEETPVVEETVTETPVVEEATAETVVDTTTKVAAEVKVEEAKATEAAKK